MFTKKGAATLLIFLLFGCSGNQAANAPASSLSPNPPEVAESATVDEEEESPDQSAASSPAGPARNARGNIVKKVGEEGAVLSPSGDTLVAFTVTKITPNFKCNQEYAPAPTLGKALAVELDVTLSPKDVGEGAVTAGLYDWQVKIIKPDGTTENGASTMIGCAKDAQQLPLNLGAGERGKGLIVVDTGQTKGALVLGLFLVEGGWEYAF